MAVSRTWSSRPSRRCSTSTTLPPCSATTASSPARAPGRSGTTVEITTRRRGGGLAEADALREQRGVDVAAREHGADLAVLGRRHAAVHQRRHGHRARPPPPRASSARGAAPWPRPPGRRTPSRPRPRSAPRGAACSPPGASPRSRRRWCWRSAHPRACAPRASRCKERRRPPARPPRAPSAARRPPPGAIPPARPPPPSGTTTSRVSGACRASSSPTVPWPATTSGWSKAWISRRPRSRESRRGLGLGLVVAAVHEGHLAAVLAHRGHLGERRPLRHHEQRRRAGRACGEGHRLGVVTGAGGHDAGRELRVGEPADRVRGAARLERAGELEVLRLEHARGPRACATARPTGSTGVSLTLPAIVSAAARTSASPMCSGATAMIPMPPRARLCAYGHG